MRTAAVLAVALSLCCFGVARAQPPTAGDPSLSQAGGPTVHTIEAGPDYWKNHASCKKSSGNPQPALDFALAKSEPTGTVVSALAGTYPDFWPTQYLALHGSVWSPTVAPDCSKAVNLLAKSTMSAGKVLASDPAFSLAAPLVAAELNFASGAGRTTDATNAINDAVRLLGRYRFTGDGYTGAVSATDARLMATLATTLAKYNERVIPPTNTAPTAAPVSKTTTVDTAVEVTLIGSDPETCELTFAIAVGPAHGTLGPISGGSCWPGLPNYDYAWVTYTPEGGFTGSDSFTYTVSDGTATSTAGGTAFLTVVLPVNTVPTAAPQSVKTAPDTSVQVPLSGSDPETCELTFAVAAGPAHGTLGPISDEPCQTVLPNHDQASVAYTPESGYEGDDSFTYTVSDGEATSSPSIVFISVKVPTNTIPTAAPVAKTTTVNAPVDVMLVGSDPETCELTFAIAAGPGHGTLGAISGWPCQAGTSNYDYASVTYTPDSGFTGSDSFTYTVSDGTATSIPGTAFLTVNP